MTTPSTGGEEEKFRSVFENMGPSGLVMIRESGAIVLANQLLEQMFGYEHGELVEQSLELLVPERFRGPHVHHRVNFFSNPHSRPMGARKELYGLRKDGTEFPVEIALNPIITDEGTFVLTNVLDITRRKQTEEMVARLARRNELLLTSAGEGIYGLDTQGHTIFVNPAAEKMLGYEPDELVGVPMHAMIHHTKLDGSPYFPEECPIYAAFNDGEVHHMDNEVLWRKDGSTFPEVVR